MFFDSLLPSSDEPKTKLQVKIAPSLDQIVEKMKITEKEKREKLGEQFLLLLQLQITCNTSTSILVHRFSTGFASAPKYWTFIGNPTQK